MHRFTVPDVTRWQKHHNQVGFGHVYQGRFKSFPVEDEDNFYQVNLYVERIALRANLVSATEDFRRSAFFGLANTERPSIATCYLLGPCHAHEVDCNT